MYDAIKRELEVGHGPVVTITVCGACRNRVDLTPFPDVDVRDVRCAEHDSEPPSRLAGTLITQKRNGCYADIG